MAYDFIFKRKKAEILKYQKTSFLSSFKHYLLLIRYITSI